MLRFYGLCYIPGLSRRSVTSPPFKSPDGKVRVAFGRWKHHSLALARGAPFPRERISGDQVTDPRFVHTSGVGEGGPA